MNVLRDLDEKKEEQNEDKEHRKINLLLWYLADPRHVLIQNNVSHIAHNVVATLNVIGLFRDTLKVAHHENSINQTVSESNS